MHQGPICGRPHAAVMQFEMLSKVRRVWRLDNLRATSRLVQVLQVLLEEVLSSQPFMGPHR